MCADAWLNRDWMLISWGTTNMTPQEVQHRQVSDGVTVRCEDCTVLTPFVTFAGHSKWPWWMSFSGSYASTLGWFFLLSPTLRQPHCISFCLFFFKETSPPLILCQSTVRWTQVPYRGASRGLRPQPGRCQDRDCYQNQRQDTSLYTPTEILDVELVSADE